MIQSTDSLVSASADIKVIRCGCGDPMRLHARTAEGGLEPCPTPREVIDLGTMSYWHRSWWRRWLWRLAYLLRRPDRKLARRA